MLVNGVEVEEGNYKQSLQIQQSVNKQTEMETSAQTEIDPKKAMKQFDDMSSGLDDSDFNVFFGQDDIASGSANSSRAGRYDTYSEMDTMEFIHRGLELIADDSSQPNDDGNTTKVYSDDQAIKDVIENLLINKLDMNNELWSILYETIKNGDNFYEVIVDDYKKPKEIRRIRYLEPKKVERIEVNGKLSHFIYKTPRKDKSDRTKPEIQEYKLFPWQILHFKIEDKENAPYGGSLLKAGVRTYRRLVMLEDVMLVYRISRAPERRVFYIDVGNLNPVEAKRFLAKMKDSYRSQSFLDENGNINKKANVTSITSDIFVPVREGSSGTRIDTLPSGTAMGASGSDDPLLKYFKDKILKTMNIPPQYMGESSDKSRSLSQLDTKFGRFIERVQAQIGKGLNKLAALELFFKGYKKEDLHNFKIEMTPPSNVKEITEIDIFNQRMTLVGTIIGLDMFSKQWIQKKILKMSTKEIADNEMQKQLEAGMVAQQGGAGVDAGGLGAGEMGADPTMDMGAEVDPNAPVVPDPNTPPEELAASAMVNVLGQDFMVENKEDFFRVVKAIEDDKLLEDTPMLPMFEAVAAEIQKPLRVPKKASTNNILAQMSVNELKGLDFKDRKFKLYESKMKRKMVKGVTSEVLVYEETEIKCGVKSYITE